MKPQYRKGTPSEAFLQEHAALHGGLWLIRSSDASTPDVVTVDLDNMRIPFSAPIESSWEWAPVLKDGEPISWDAIAPSATCEKCGIRYKAESCPLCVKGKVVTVRDEIRAFAEASVLVYLNHGVFDFGQSFVDKLLSGDIPVSRVIDRWEMLFSALVEHEKCANVVFELQENRKALEAEVERLRAEIGAAEQNHALLSDLAKSERARAEQAEAAAIAERTTRLQDHATLMENRAKRSEETLCRLNLRAAIEAAPCGSSCATLRRSGGHSASGPCDCWKARALATQPAPVPDARTIRERLACLADEWDAIATTPAAQTEDTTT